MRQTKIVIVPPATGERPNRDAGKAYFLQEMPAAQAEKWSTRALLAMANGGLDIPPEVVAMGAAAVISAGFRGLLTMAFADAEPLLDEMMQCVSFVPDRTKPDVVRPLIDDDIEEVATRILLRSELVELHTGFSIAGFLSNLGKSANPLASSSSDTPTSPGPSAP